MEKNTALMQNTDQAGESLAILDTVSLEREVDNLWGLNQEIESEIRSPISRFYRGALKILGRDNGENRVYSLLTGMQEGMQALSIKFEVLQRTYETRTTSMVRFLTEQQEKLEDGNALLKKIEAGVDERASYIEKSKVELVKMNNEQDGYYRLNGKALLTFIEKKDLEGLELALEKTMDLRNEVTRRSVVDLLSATRVHGVLTGFNEGLKIVFGYFQNAIGIKMYEIQAGHLTEEAKKQLEGFGKVVRNFYAEAKKGIKHVKAIESGNLLDLGLKNRNRAIVESSFESTVVKYLQEKT